MKIGTDGQVTIPQHMLDQIGLLPDTEVELTVMDDGVLVRKVREKPADAHLYFKQMRGRFKGGMSTDEVMALTRGEE
ncbi:MAG TPA: AbrB/MazE/SpoVT family DNA-binding domain-containing protein [Longimicrobium sp.]|jgi:bifunctional DNA-binding transcriptional regulator/antitoxin component of YhaV-PrlF toxin-antitoxin module